MPLLFNIILEILVNGIRQEKNKRHTDWKGINTLLVDYVIIYVENLKGSTKRPLELINEFSQDTRSIIQNKTIFLYTSN